MPTLENPKITGSLNVHNCSVELRDSSDVLTAYLNFAQAHFNEVNFTTDLGHTFLNGVFEFTTGGYVRQSIVVAADGPDTFSAGDCTLIVIPATVAGTGNLYKLNNTTVVGATIKFVNYSAQPQIITDQAGIALVYGAGVVARSGTVPGHKELVWLNNGTYTGWSAVS